MQYAEVAVPNMFTRRYQNLYHLPFILHSLMKEDVG